MLSTTWPKERSQKLVEKYSQSLKCMLFKSLYRCRRRNRFPWDTLSCERTVRVSSRPVLDTKTRQVTHYTAEEVASVVTNETGGKSLGPAGLVFSTCGVLAASVGNVLHFLCEAFIHSRDYLRTVAVPIIKINNAETIKVLNKQKQIENIFFG